MTQTDTPADQPFCRFLKFWRSVHNLSQEQLAERLDCSPRHISRLENGSSGPSEAITLQIAETLNLGERDTDHLLISAGFVALERKIDFQAPQLKWLRKAMLLTLRAADPYPTALLDASSNILMVNRAWVSFYSHSITPSRLRQVTNHYDFLFSSEGAGGFVSGWEDTLSVILMSLQQMALFSNSDVDKALVERLAKHQNVPTDWRTRAAALEPMASFRIQVSIAGALQRFYSVNNTVGAMGPTAYASEPRLIINTLYPEDDAFDLTGLMDSDATHPLLFY